MKVLNIRHNGKIIPLELLETSDTELFTQIKQEIYKVTHIPLTNQKIIGPGGKKLELLNDFEKNRILESLINSKKSLIQVTGSTIEELDLFKKSARETEEIHRKNVVDDLDVDYELILKQREEKSKKKEIEKRRKDAMSTEYRFHNIKVLEGFQDKDKAFELLESLALDPGFLGVLRKHKWSVGTLSEMYPDGKVGVDPVCVLGLNVNKGMEIKLRIRTDDLLGFRKIETIKETLCHELSHNVFGDHDKNFFNLMRQVQKEIIDPKINWQASKGQAVGGENRMIRPMLARPMERENSKNTKVSGGVYKLSDYNNDSEIKLIGVETSQSTTDNLLEKRVSYYGKKSAINVNKEIDSSKMEIDKEMIDTNRFECHKKNESISNSNCECVRHNDENQKFDISVNQISKEGSQGVRNGRDDVIDKNCKNCKNEICNIDGDNNESSKSTEDSQDSKLKLSLPSLSKEQVCQINDAVNRLIERNSLDMTLLSSVQFLKKIFRKILDFPYQEKYRKIRITSKTFKQNEKNGTRQLLSEVGWVSNLDDCLRLPDNNDLVFSKINCCLNALNSVELILLEVSSS